MYNILTTWVETIISSNHINGYTTNSIYFIVTIIFIKFKKMHTIIAM